MIWTSPDDQHVVLFSDSSSFPSFIGEVFCLLAYSNAAPSVHQGKVRAQSPSCKSFTSLCFWLLGGIVHIGKKDRFYLEMSYIIFLAAGHRPRQLQEPVLPKFGVVLFPPFPLLSSCFPLSLLFPLVSPFPFHLLQWAMQLYLLIELGPPGPLAHYSGSVGLNSMFSLV